MKKIFAAICLASILVLGGCNYDLLDTEYKFDYAIVKMPDGVAQKIDIRSWGDYDGEQIQITDTDGHVYLVNSVNCVLVKEAE